MFDGKQTMILPISEMIHLIKRNGKKMLPKSDFDKLQDWSQAIYGRPSKLGLWRYVNEEK